MSTIAEMWRSGGAYGSAKGLFLASLECEIEGVASEFHGVSLPEWRCVADGSLRNNGFEYTSIQPHGRSDLVDSFKKLHATLKLKKGEDSFSERTSTHVHINVAPMEAEHVRQMVLLYALFEEFFYAMVTPNRRDNIHCVPLTETFLPNEYYRDIVELYGKWHKYTGLNLKRMGDLGTIEFRHLHGTNDPVVVDQWLHVMENLWKLSQRIQIDVASLSDKAQITEWFELLFFPADKIMMLKPSLFDIIKNSLIDVKFSTIRS